jgi:hypothetical protein
MTSIYKFRSYNSVRNTLLPLPPSPSLTPPLDPLSERVSLGWWSWSRTIRPEIGWILSLRGLIPRGDSGRDMLMVVSLVGTMTLRCYRAWWSRRDHELSQREIKWLIELFQLFKGQLLVQVTVTRSWSNHTSGGGAAPIVSRIGRIGVMGGGREAIRIVLFWNSFGREIVITTCCSSHHTRLISCAMVRTMRVRIRVVILLLLLVIARLRHRLIAIRRHVLTRIIAPLRILIIVMINRRRWRRRSKWRTRTRARWKARGNGGGVLIT